MMINRKQLLSFLAGSTFLLFLAYAQIASAKWEDHLFINSKDDRDVVSSSSVLDKAKSYTEEELKEKKLAVGDDEYLVLSFIELGYWLPSATGFSAEIDEKNSAHGNALKRLDEITRQAALRLQLAAEVIQMLFRQSAFQVGASVGAWRTMALKVNGVAIESVTASPYEVIERDLQ